MTFITEQGLAQLKKYSYKSGKYTWMDNALQPYWQGVVKLVPTWVAPNCITFIGFLILLSSYICMLFYDFTFKKNIPSWCFYYASASVWIYSTLDAIDGKQARRTKSSSPLGQLFDHGCDSFSTSFVILCIAQAAKLQALQALTLFLAGYTAFWISNWKQYNTGILLTNVGQFGVTQSQILCCIIFFLTGIFGQDFWQIEINSLLPSFFVNYSIHELWRWSMNLKIGGFIALYFGGLICLLSFYTFLVTLLQSEKKFRPIKQCFPFFILVGIFWTWYTFDIFTEYVALILFNFGLIVATIVCKIIISSVTKMKLRAFHIQILPIIIATILVYIFNIFHLKQLIIYIFWVQLTINIVMIYIFLKKSINTISNFLGIYCFSLEKRPQKSQ